MKLFQKRVVCTKFDIYVCITKYKLELLNRFYLQKMSFNIKRCFMLNSSMFKCKMRLNKEKPIAIKINVTQDESNIL